MTQGGKAIESKVGRTSLTSSIKRQIAKDVELMSHSKSGIKSVEWHFSKSGVTGEAGPTAPLRLELERAGIKVVE